MPEGISLKLQLYGDQGFRQQAQEFFRHFFHRGVEVPFVPAQQKRDLDRSVAGKDILIRGDGFGAQQVQQGPVLVEDIVYVPVDEDGQQIIAHNHIQEGLVFLPEFQQRNGHIQSAGIVTQMLAGVLDTIIEEPVHIGAETISLILIIIIVGLPGDPHLAADIGNGNGLPGGRGQILEEAVLNLTLPALGGGCVSGTIMGHNDPFSVKTGKKALLFGDK